MQGRWGLTRLALVAGTALALAGCQTSEQAATSSAVTPIGFEGFIGVPQPVGQEIARELVRATDGRRFTLVPSSDANARYVMRGYLAPAGDGGRVAYVWDLFDRSGRMAQRLSGDVPLPQGDAWAALSSGAARPLAVASAGAIDAFLQRPAGPAQPSARLAEAPAPARPAAAQPGEAAATVTAFAAAETTQPGGQPGPNRPAARRRVVVEAVAGLEPGEANVLAAAMRRALGELGYAVQPPGTNADVVLSADVTLNPAAGNGRLISVAWQVADGAGRTLGEIRQMARLPETALAREAASAFTRAVEAALPGLVALAPPR